MRQTPLDRGCSCGSDEMLLFAGSCAEVVVQLVRVVEENPMLPRLLPSAFLQFDTNGTFCTAPPQYTREKYADLTELINNFSLSQRGSLSQIHPGHQIRTIAGASNRCTMPPIYIEVLAVFIFSQQTRRNPQRSWPSC